MSEIVKNSPSSSEYVLIIGTLILATGISFHWGWPIACEVIGILLVVLSVTAKLRGND